MLSEKAASKKAVLGFLGFLSLGIVLIYFGFKPLVWDPERWWYKKYLGNSVSSVNLPETDDWADLWSKDQASLCSKGNMESFSGYRFQDFKAINPARYPAHGSSVGRYLCRGATITGKASMRTILSFASLTHDELHYFSWAKWDSASDSYPNRFLEMYSGIPIMHDSTWYLSSFDAKSGITNSNEVAALGWVCGNKSVNLQLVIAERREESEKSKLLHDRYDKGWQTLEPYIREICGSKDNPRPLEKLVGIPQLNIEEMLNQGLTARQTIKECTKAYYELRRT